MLSSIATNLPKLRRLIIDNCETIKEIVASDKENDAGELAFMKLEFLRLYNLPQLRSFYKGRYNLKFPMLQKLFVAKCDMIETFSYVVLNAPKLRAVYLTDSSKGPWRWNGDLNTTIKKHFAETNSKDD
ncbi:disease resistance protein UNI [Trifolium repens]|nr:disease resistance protein UNI [Trifolium repens]